MSMFKKLIVLLTLSLGLSGCGYFERMTATATGYSTQCINGVEYLQFTSGASVAYTSEGKIKTC